MNKPTDPAMNQSPDYTEAFKELQAIISELEDGEISVDTLSEKVKRAAFLIKICKDKLHATEGDVNKILAELESDGGPEED
jgi:exodeoxyribonuclease VII small subunit